MKLDLDIKVKTCQTDTITHAVELVCIARSAESDSSSNTDPNVFVILKIGKNWKGLQDYGFSHVADPVDMLDYPPYLDLNSPYFRTNEITLRVRSAYVADKTAKNIYYDVKKLVDHINYLEALDPVNYYLGGICLKNGSLNLSGVASVNGQTGVVTLEAQDVGALTKASNLGKVGQVLGLTTIGNQWIDCSGTIVGTLYNRVIIAESDSLVDRLWAVCVLNCTVYLPPLLLENVVAVSTTGNCDHVYIRTSNGLRVIKDDNTYSTAGMLIDSKYGFVLLYGTAAGWVIIRMDQDKVHIIEPLWQLL